MALNPRKAQAKAKKSSTKSLDFGTLTDYRTRLEGTVVRYKDKFVFVERIAESEGDPKLLGKYHELHRILEERHMPDEERFAHQKKTAKALEAFRKSVAEKPLKALLVPLVSSVSKKKRIEAFVKDLDLRLFSLGFINDSTYGAVYASRVAKQQWKQGVSRNNTLATPVLAVKGVSRGVKIDIMSPEFAQALQGEYPTVQGCLEELFPQEGTTSKAFHRNFALSVDEVGNVSLFYRTKRVGASRDEGETFILMGRYEYLKESLIELGVKINDC